MERTYRFSKYWFAVIAFFLMLSSCNVVKFIGGDKRWIKNDLGLSNTADSLMIPLNSSYENARIFEKKTGAYYSFNTVNSVSTNFIVWKNGWHTIVLYDVKEELIIYYSYDKKNRLRMLDRFSTACNRYISKIEFNKKGEIIYIQNQGTAF